MKRKTKAKVILQKKLQENIYDLRLSTDLAKEAHAGQFVGIYTNDRSKLLPRPISICEIDDNRLRLVYRVTAPGSGTDVISRLKPGDDVDIIGILGNGYDTDDIVARFRHPVLMGGGIGIPPMLQLAKELDYAYGKLAAANAASNIHDPDHPVVRRYDTHISAILGYRDSNLFLAGDFKDVSKVYIATEDGSEGTMGNVLDVMRLYAKSGDVSGTANADVVPEADSAPSSGPVLSECDVILACGPMPMLRAIASYAKENGIKAFVSLEERMACGIGACLGCITTTKTTDSHSHVNNARICTDGPVFDADDLEF